MRLFYVAWVENKLLYFIWDAASKKRIGIHGVLIRILYILILKDISIVFFMHH